MEAEDDPQGEPRRPCRGPNGAPPGPARRHGQDRLAAPQSSTLPAAVPVRRCAATPWIPSPAQLTLLSRFRRCLAVAAAEGEVRTYVCRCGDVYVLHPGDAELAELEAVVVPCCSCSNHMLVRLRAPAGG